MTRYTDFGRKRTHVQAGFDDVDPLPVASTSQSGPIPETSLAPPSEEVAAEPPAKKKRKRTPKSKRDNYGQGKPEELSSSSDATGNMKQDEGESDGKLVQGAVRTAKQSKKAARKAKLKQLSKDAKARKAASEDRRMKRISERHATTTCLACREKGHLARDCPNTKASKGPSKSLVGICYRCGSRTHSLSRCKAAVDPDKPLPFASCFVCNGTGHLASACPQNKDKGVYPNGGCCKLCGEVTHLARNCGLRKDELSNRSTFLGTGKEAGADEDDFHIFGRKKREVDQEEKSEERTKRLADVKVGVLTGRVRAFSSTSVVQPQKVVTF